MSTPPTLPPLGTPADPRKKGLLPRLATGPTSSQMPVVVPSPTWPCSPGEKSRLDQIHTEIGQQFLSELESLLKQPLRLESTQLDLPIYSRFATSADYPSLTVSARDASAQHHVAWHCPGVTTAYLLDALLGGGRYLPPPPQHALTEIEMGLLSRLATRLWKHVETHWSAVTSMQLETQHLDCEEPRLRIAAANELMLNVIWTFSSQHVRTNMHLMYPWLEVQRMLRQLTPESPTTPHLSDNTATLVPNPQSRPAATNVALNWASTTLPSHEFRRLDVGDLIVTDVPADSPVPIFCDGRFRGLGRVIRQHDQFRLMIEAFDRKQDSP